MKKITAFLALVFALTAGTASQASVGDHLLLYLPNRIVDSVDIISLSLGFGPVVRADVWVTRAFSFGAGVGADAKVIKQINRQYGAGLESGWEASFLMMSAEQKELSETSRGVKKYYHYATGVPSIDEKVYEFYDGARDYWSVGVNAAVFFEVDAEFHAIELFDFVTGFVFIDLKDDDFTMDNIRN